MNASSKRHSLFNMRSPAVRVDNVLYKQSGVHVLQDVINFLYTIRGEMFYWALMGLVLVWICDLFGLWNLWGKRDD